MRAQFDTLLPGAALVFCTATQLRVPGIPVGLGEILLVFWMLRVFVAQVQSRRMPSSSGSLRVFGGFWGFTLLLLPLSIWSGYRMGILRLGPMVHDILAYGLALAVTLVMASISDTSDRLRAHLRWLTLLAALACGLLWLLAQGVDAVAGVDLWYGGHGARFRGWSANPNQMALLILPLPFLLMYVFVDAAPLPLGKVQAGCAPLRSRPSQQVLAAGLIALVFAAGLQSGSNALHLVWAIFLPLQLLYYLLSWLSGRTFGKASAGLMLAGVLLGWLMLSLASVASTWESGSSGTAGSEPPVVAAIREDGNVRLHLIKNGIQAVAASPVVGLGPGAHSGMTAPFEGSEAHNSLVDWATNFGLLGAVAMSGLIVWLAYRLYRVGEYTLLMGLLALSLFGMAHHVMRHPLIWILLVLLSRLAEARAATEQTMES